MNSRPGAPRADSHGRRPHPGAYTGAVLGAVVGALLGLPFGAITWGDHAPAALRFVTLAATGLLAGSTLGAACWAERRHDHRQVPVRVDPARRSAERPVIRGKRR